MWIMLQPLCFHWPVIVMRTSRLVWNRVSISAVVFKIEVGCGKRLWSGIEGYAGANNAGSIAIYNSRCHL